MYYPGGWQGDTCPENPEIVWSQTSNPTESNDKVDDFVRISTNWLPFWSFENDKTHSFNGLALSSQRDVYMDGMHPHGDWYYGTNYAKASRPSWPLLATDLNL